MGKKKKRFVPHIPVDALTVPIIDNHTHISTDPQTDTETEPIQRYDENGQILMPVLTKTLLAGMKAAGVRGAITSGCEIPEFLPTITLAEKTPNIWAAIALHPNEAAMHAGALELSPDGLTHEPEAHHLRFDLNTAIELSAQYASKKECITVGETGLDYYRTAESGKSAQKKAFRAHIRLAKELNKPMQIHDREAHTDVVEILKRDGAPEKTVFHCFSGDRELAQICRENGWYASFAGPLTYPVNTQLQQAFDLLPKELILIETDAPYLTPVPYRGHPNVSWACVYTAQYMAQRRNTDLDTWCEQLNRNTSAVYGI